MRPSFAYLFERFPSFIQLFTLREVEGITAQGAAPLVFSIRERQERPDAPLISPSPVTFLPDKETLRESARALAARKELPKTLLPALQQWGDKPDKLRLYEAAWLGPRLRRAGVRHVHAHFAGIAARTCYWLKKFFGLTYSFTGHANDIFRETPGPVTLRDLIENASFVAVVSDFSRRELLARFPGIRTPVFTVYNGIDCAACPPADPAAAPPQILSVGRLVEKKGFPVLIRACALLAAQGRQFSCRIAGDGPLRDTLAQQIRSLGLEQLVFLEGPKSEPEIRSLLAASRVFALACVAEHDGGMDNLPTVITEAMASGLPVVSTRLAGVPEQVLDGRTGFLCEPGNAAELSEALAKCLDDPALCARLGQAGRERAREVFSLANTVRRLKHLLLRCGRARLTLPLLRADPSALLARAARPLPLPRFTSRRSS